jgi:hypothetical protein
MLALEEKVHILSQKEKDRSDLSPSDCDHVFVTPCEVGVLFNWYHCSKCNWEVRFEKWESPLMGDKGVV